MFENICEIFMVLPFPQVQDVLFRLLQLQIPVHSLAQSIRLLEPEIFSMTSLKIKSRNPKSHEIRNLKKIKVKVNVIPNGSPDFLD